MFRTFISQTFPYKIYAYLSSTSCSRLAICKTFSHHVSENSHQIYVSDNALQLQHCGFSKDNAEKFLEKHPAINRQNSDTLISTIDSLLKCQFGEQQLTRLIEIHPNILLSTSKTIESHFIFLSVVYKKSTIFKIFLNSPQVLNDTKEALETKIEYLEKKMGFSKPEIGRSGALGYSLKYIRERLIFLERAGKYKFIKEKNRPFEINTNPSLESILNNSPEEFSTKVAGLSLFEFEVFQELLAEEGDPEENDDDFN